MVVTALVGTAMVAVHPEVDGKRHLVPAVGKIQLVQQVDGKKHLVRNSVHMDLQVVLQNSMQLNHHLLQILVPVLLVM